MIDSTHELEEDDKGGGEVSSEPIVGEPPRPVVFASYPKTGSTLLFTLVARYRRLRAEQRVSQRLVARAKNNFLIEYQSGARPTFLLKTHLLPETYVDRLRTDPASKDVGDVPAGRAVWTWLSESGGGAIYGIRNPFTQFFSAVDYSRMVYAREGIAETWRVDGRAKAYFQGVLGFKEIPSPEEFAGFDVHADGSTALEDRLWRYVEGRGTLPIFEGGGSPTYFDHVNHCFARTVLQPRHLVVTYERLMQADAEMLAGLAELLDLSVDKLTAAFQSEADERAARSGRYGNNPFFAAFRVSTPESVRQLPSWSRLRQACMEACPPLKMTLAEH